MRAPACSALYGSRLLHGPSSPLRGACAIRAPVVSVDGEGLHDRRIAGERFRWDEISAVEAYEAENLTWVGLDFKEPAASLAKTGWLVRLSAPLHRLLRFPRVSISMALLDGSSDDLISAVRARRPDLVTKA